MATSYAEMNEVNGVRIKSFRVRKKFKSQTIFMY